MKKKTVYSLFLATTFLGSITNLEGTNVDSDYRWEQCKAIILQGSSYTIPRDALVEILLQAGADPNIPDDEGVLPIERPVLKVEPIRDPLIKPGTDIRPIIDSAPQISIESSIGILLFTYGAEMPCHFYTQRAAFGMMTLKKEKFDRKYWEEYRLEEYRLNYNPVKEAISKSKYLHKKTRGKVSQEMEQILTQLLHHVLVIFGPKVQPQNDKGKRFRRTNTNVFPLSIEILLFIILNIGIDINKTDLSGRTLLQYAREANLPTIVDILIAHGATDT